MASVFATKKLLDIATDAVKKKTETVQEDERSRVLNALKSKAFEKMAGTSVQTGVQTAAAPVNTYVQNKNYVETQNKAIADAEAANAAYIRQNNPSLPVDKATYENTAYSHDEELVDRRGGTLEAEHQELGQRAASVRRFEEQFPKARQTTEALYKLLEDSNKKVVDPFGNAAEMRYDAAQLKSSAAQYAPGSWQDREKGSRARNTAAELVRSAGIIENPQKALEETNANLQEMERILAVTGKEGYMGVSREELENGYDNLKKQQALLEGAAVDKNAAERREWQQNLLRVANNEEERTDADVMAEMKPEQVHALGLYLKNMPEGMSLKDYDPDTIAQTIGLTAEEKNAYEDLLATDPQKAADFLAAKSEDINKRKAAVQDEWVQELTRKSALGAAGMNALGMLAGVAMAPIESTYTIYKQLKGEDIDPNSPAYSAGRMGQVVKSTTKGMIEDAVENPVAEKILSGAYDVGYGALENIARMLLYRSVGIGGNAGTAMMAYGTYGQNVADAIESGATQGEAALLAAVNAGVEYATEWLPTNTYMRLLDGGEVKGAGKIMKDIAEAVLGDGLGEAANSMITTYAENKIQDYGNSIERAVNDYMYNGEAENVEEAYRMAWKDAWRNALYEGIVGALSAGLVGGSIDTVTNIAGRVQERRNARKEQNTAEELQEVPEAPAEEPGKVTLESMAQEMTAQQEQKPAAKVTVQTPAEYVAARGQDETAQEAQEKKPPLRKDGAVVTATDNGYTVEKDGQNVNLDEMDAQSADARMLNAAPDMVQDAANDMLARYDEKGDVDAQDYAKGYKAVYDAALQGKTLEDAQGLYADELTDAQRRSAYQKGTEARRTENTRVEHMTRQIASRSGFRARSSDDGVSLENVAHDLTAEEKTTFRLLDAVGKRFGLNIRIYDTLAGGMANASYTAGTNVVNIARDAEGGALTRAASHEIYHYLESFSKEDAQKIRAFVLDKLQSNEEFDLDGMRQQYAARYANVKDADIDAEIVADSVLDVIGTEENIRLMAKDSPNLLAKINEVLTQIRNFLRRQLERLAGSSELVDTMLQDEETLAEVQRMVQQGLENAKANREAGYRVTEAAMQDADVQAYMADLGEAKNETERANALESLAQKKYAATQGSAFAEPDDYDRGYDVWRQTLKDFADKKGALNALLKEAGLATTKSQQENAVLAVIGRELKRVDESGVRTDGEKKFAVKKRWDADGNVIRYVRATRKIIKGEDHKKWGEQITEYINKQLRHNVDVNVIGEDGEVLTLTADTAGKAAYWNTYTDKNGNKRRVSKEQHRKKLGAEAHIDELLEVSYRSGAELTDDTKNHPFAKDGWDYRQAYFVDYDGTPYRVTISVGYNGGVITAYNVGKLNKTAFAEGLKARAMLQNNSAMEGNAVSDDSIQTSERNVNTKFSLKMTPALKKQEEEIYEQMRLLRDEETQLREKKVDYNKDAKTLELVERIVSAETREEVRKAIKELAAHEEAYGVKGIEERIREIGAEIHSLETKENAIRAEALNNTVKDSGKTEAEYFEKEAVKEFGYTPYFVDAGYILKNGKMLNFSGEKGKHYGMRGQDHRAVSTLFEGTKGGTEAMIAFMRYGNIRIMDETPGIDISTVEAVTKEQLATIKKHVRESAGRGLYVVDFDDADGRTIDTLTYEGRVNAERVVADILHYYETGEIREQSVVSMFHSQKGDDANFFAGMYEDAEVRDAGKLIMRLERMRREKQFTTGEWQNKTGDIAKQLLKDTNSGMNQGALTRKINTMFRAMDQGNVTPNQLMEYAYGIAEKVAEGAGEEMQLEDGARLARNYIRSHRIYLNDNMQSEVRAQYGDLRSFYSKHFGTAKFTTDRKATSLEDMWGELNQMHPGYFPADAHASEMPELLSKFLEVTGKVNRNYFGVNEQQLKQDVAMRLFWEYYKLPGTYGDQQAKMKEMVDQFGDMLDSLRESYQVRLKQGMEEFKQREEKLRQRNMLERSVKAMTKRLLKPTKNQHIPDEMRGAVASMLEIVNTSGSKKGQEARTKAYAQLQAAIAELRKTDVGYAYVDPDMEAYLQELQEKAGHKSVMSMNLQELKDLNKVISGIRHACTVSDQLLTAGHKGSVAAIADDARSALDTMKDRKVRSDIGNTVVRFGKYAMEDAPRFFRDMARYTGKAGKTLWDIVRHGGLDKQITLLKEAETKLEEIRSKYKGYENWMSRNSESKSFITESGKIELTTGQIMALYLLNKRKQARSHIYGIQGNDGGIAQKRVNTKDGARESVRPSKVNEAQVDYIIGTLTKEQKAFADEMSALLNGWCSDLGNEVSMQMYGYKKYNEKNYFPIEVWGGRTDATSGEARQNILYLILNKAFTKEVQDKAQAPLVIPDMFDAVTEHINGMIVYNAWAAPVTDMIKFINHKFRDDSVTMDQNGMEVFALGQNIIGTVKEDLSRVMGEGAERWYVQLIEDINGLAKNKVEKDVAGFVNKLTRNFKATAVGYNIGTMLKQPTSVIRAFDVIPPMYFAGKPVVPNKQRQEIMEKYAPIVTWKGYGNFTMDTGKSIEKILFPESATKMERFNEWGMAGAGYMDNVTWHNIWAAAERMAAKQNKDLERGTDAFYKKTAEIFNQCIDQTQTVDSILHRSQMMRQDTAWLKSVTTFMGEPTKAYNMLLDAVNDWKTANTKERARKVSKTAGVLAVNAATAAFVNSLLSALRNWDDEDPFWQQVWQKMFGQYEEDMTTGEKFMEAIFRSNIASELNILNYIPFARDVMETFAGYDVERVDMSLFADVRDAVEALKSEKMATPEKIMGLVGALGNFVGVPAKNIMAESKRIWNWYNKQMEAFGLDTLDSQYAFLLAQKNIGASSNLTEYANLLLKAEKQGRTDLVEKIRADMLEVGTEEEKIDSKLYKLQVQDLTGIKDASYEKTYAALGEAMKAGNKELATSLTKELKRAGRTDEQIESGLVTWLKEDPRVISAAQKAMNGNTTEKAQLVKTLRAEGFSDAVAKKAINQLQNKLVSDNKKAGTKAEEKPKEPEYEALYTTYDLQTAIENGSDVDDILEDLRKQGREDSSIKSSITSAIKPLYISLMSGTASDKAQAKKIKERLMQLDLKVKYDSKTIDGWLK